MSGKLPLPKLGSHWILPNLHGKKKKFVGIKVVSMDATLMKSQQYGCLYETRTTKTSADVPRCMEGGGVQGHNPQ